MTKAITCFILINFTLFLRCVPRHGKQNAWKGNDLNYPILPRPSAKFAWNWNKLYVLIAHKGICAHRNSGTGGL